MASRKFFLTFFVLIAIGFQIFLIPLTPSDGKFANAQYPLGLSLGYGLSTLSPVENGIPIYSVNDTLWVQSSNLDVTLSLLRAPVDGSCIPNGTSFTETATFNTNYTTTTTTGIPIITICPYRSTAAGPLQFTPQTAAMLYQFNSSDPEGTWILNVSSPEISYEIQVSFVNPSNHVLSPPNFNYILQNSQLLMNFALPSADAYNIEGCTSSTPALNNFSIPIPQNLGSGNLQLSNTGGGALQILVPGSISSAFNFWFEFHFPYSYGAPNGGGIVTRDLISAKSSAELLNPGTKNLNASLVNLAFQRPGRVSVFAFFDSAKGLSLEQTRVLVLDNSTWFWLSGSCQTLGQITPGQVFTSTSNLNAPISQWPTTFIAMSDSDGIETDMILPLELGLSKATFIAAPWNVNPSDISIRGLQTPFVNEISVFNGTMYLVATTYPLEVNYVLSFQGVTFANRSVTLFQPFQSYPVFVPLGKIIAQVFKDGKPVSGTIVSAKDIGLGVALSKTTDAGGFATFYVPPGNFTVSGTFDNINQSQAVSIAEEKAVGVTLNFSSGIQSQPELLYLEIATVVGLLANVWIWLLRPRMATRRLTR